MDRTLEELQTVARHLLGNGQPGVIDRLTRTEENLKKTAEATSNLAEEVAESTRAVSKQMSDLHNSLLRLTDIVETHHMDKDIHSPRMFLKKDIVMLILVILVLLHTVLENGGMAKDMILNFLGL